MRAQGNASQHVLDVLPGQAGSRLRAEWPACLGMVQHLARRKAETLSQREGQPVARLPVRPGEVIYEEPFHEQERSG